MWGTLICNSSWIVQIHYIYESSFKEHYLACKMKYLATKTHLIFDCDFNFNFASFSTECSEWHKSYGQNI